MFPERFLVKFLRMRLMRFGLIILFIASGPAFGMQQGGSSGDARNPAGQLKAIDQLIEQNRQLEKQNQQLLEEIISLRQALAANPELTRTIAAQPKAPSSPESVNVAHSGGEVPLAEAKETATSTASNRDAPSSVQSASPSAQGAETQQSYGAATPQSNDEEKKWGRYTPNLGYKVADTEHGDLSISIYTYGRYLNQRMLDATFKDAFGNVKTVQQRQDFQLQKVQFKFLGWVLDPKLRYYLWAWTSNASMGLGAQVVLAGNFSYAFNDHFNLAGGIMSLPGTRSVEGQFPFWLAVDSRQIADEFFRPSYTSGVQAKGKINRQFRYQAMVGDNLSYLGVSAAQLTNHFSTFAGALVWESAGEFGIGFGDFEDHQKLISRIGAHFTRSDENKQSQPNNDAFENTQIRLSDGSIIFTPNLFGPGVTVTDVNYKMADFDGGLKYHGMSLDAEYFMRWLSRFQGPGTETLHPLFDQGFQIQTSAMVVPKTLQLYAGGSTVFGKFGNPWDTRVGFNWFPWKNRVIRWNNEALFLYKSPVGYTSVPFALGGRGPVFYSTVEMAF